MDLNVLIYVNKAGYPNPHEIVDHRFPINNQDFELTKCIDKIIRLQDDQNEQSMYGGSKIRVVSQEGFEDRLNYLKNNNPRKFKKYAVLVNETMECIQPKKCKKNFFNKKCLLKLVEIWELVMGKRVRIVPESMAVLTQRILDFRVHHYLCKNTSKHSKLLKLN